MTSSRQRQGGAFLLEALVGLLIFSFGILGIVALQAQSIRFTSEAEIRAEATYLANSLVSTMWTDFIPTDKAGFKAKYESTGSGAGYTAFQAAIAAGMPGVTLPNPPVVTIDDASIPIAAQSQQSSIVLIEIDWLNPGDSVPHNYRTTAVVGLN